MKVLLTMANNASTPYFNRFADLESVNKEVDLEFLCLYPTRPHMIDEMAQKGFKCHWLKFDCKKRKRSIIVVFLKAILLLIKIKPHIIHTHLFDDSLPLLFAARIVRIKHRIISKLDAGFHYNYKPKWVKLDKFNNWNAIKIVSVSGENRNFILNIEGAAENKVELIHQGLNYNEVSSYDEQIKKNLADKFNLHNKRIALTVSRYIDWKGYKYIIDAAELLKSSYPDLRFCFLGSGNQEKELKAYVKEKNLVESIFFVGWVSRAELNAFYSLADVFVHAALNEPFGFVIAEAMLNKLPIVSTKTGAAYDAISHLENGYFAKKKSGVELAKGIEYMLTNNNHEIVTKAFKKAKDLFLVEKMWMKHKSLYKSCL